MANDFKTRIVFQVSILLYLSTIVHSAPASNRNGKYLFDLISSTANGYQNDISRTSSDQSHQFNSPIYYIRLPPVPYSFVPGLGYVSQPNSAPSPGSMVNLPLPFLGNGKPVTVYQWSGAYDGFSQKPVQKPVVPKPVYDSTIHRVPGQFVFNGKPNDVFVLRDSYNSLYDDALQNLYP